MSDDAPHPDASTGLVSGAESVPGSVRVTSAAEPEPAHAARPATMAALLVAMLLALAGLVLLLLGLIGTHTDVVPFTWPTGQRWAWCAAAAVATALVAVTRYLVSRADAHDADARARRRAYHALASVAALTCAGVIIGYGASALAYAASQDFAGSTAIWFVGGGVCVGVGMVVQLFVVPRRLTRPRARALAVCWLPAAVLAVLTGVGVVTAPGWFVDRTTAASATPLPVPSRIDKVTWSRPVAGTVRELIAAGSGVVLSDNRKIMALDGATGKVRWTYARHGSVPINLNASPDQRTVAFELDRVAHGKDVVTQTVVLDAITGATRITYAEPANPHDLSKPYLTDDSLIVGTGLGFDQDTHMFRAISLRTGREAWSYTDPTTCDGSNNPGFAAVPSGMLIAHACDGGPAVTLFDAATGRRKWSAPSQSPTQLSLTADGRYVAVQTHPDPKFDQRDPASEASADAQKRADNARYSLLDTRTGRVVLRANFIQVADGGPIASLADGHTTYYDPQTLAPLALGDIASEYVDHDSARYGSTPIGGGWYVRTSDNTDVPNPATSVRLAAGPFAGATHEFVVTLGGPFRERAGAGLAITPAPGAVVIWESAPPASGRSSHVVGLTAATDTGG